MKAPFTKSAPLLRLALDGERGRGSLVAVPLNNDENSIMNVIPPPPQIN